MKKALALLLSALLLLALAACGAGGSTNAPAANEPAAAEPEAAEPAAAEPAAAEPEEPADAPAADDSLEGTLVGYCLSSVNDEMTLTQATSMQEKFENVGVQMDYVSADEDIAMQISQIENYVTMGAKMVIISSNEPSALKECVESAMNDGVLIVMSGEANIDRLGYTPSGANAMNGYTAGTYIANMALQWAQERYPDAEPGSIHVGIMTINGVSMSDDCTKAYHDVLDGTICDITYESPLCITADMGYDAAQEAMSFDPDIRIFLGFTVDAVVGANNYIQANSADYDLADFGAFCCGTSTTATALIDSSADNEAILRGLIVIGDPNDVTIDLWEVCYGLLTGTLEPPAITDQRLSTYNAIGYTMPE